MPLDEDLNDAALWDSLVSGDEAAAKADPAPTDTRVRDDQGRFAPKEAQTDDGAEFKPVDADPKPQAKTEQQSIEPKTEDQPADPTLATPPKSWSAKAKAKWDGLDPELKAEMHRREADVDKGFAQYAGLARHVEAATRAGTTLPEALDRYVAAENLLEKDFTLGVAELARMAGIPLDRLVADIQARASQLAGPSPSPQPSQPQRPVDVRATVEDVLNDQKARDEISRFFADPKNRYAENVRPLMADFLRSGRAGSLQDAYDMACWADPDVRKALQVAAPSASPPAKQAAVKQARQASGSLTASPPLVNGKSASNASPSAADAALWDEMGL